MDTAQHWEAHGQESPRQVGVAPRAIAAIIDAIGSALLLGLPLAVLMGDKTTTSDGTMYWTMNADTFVAWVVLTLVYFIVFETLFGGTIGKVVLGLRVRRSDGSPVDFYAAVIRNVLRLIDCVPYFIPYLLGAFFIWAGEDRQRLGDRLADTIVTWR